MTHTNNHIDYVEFTAPDLGAIKAFYGKVFGWEFQDWGEDYISFSSAGLEGGFHRAPAPSSASSSPSLAASGALIILYTDDLEATEKKVSAAGGKITAHHEFPGGRRFHFVDPAGNVLGVWTLAAQD